MADFIDWPGKSGKSYRYWFVDPQAPQKDEGCNYIFVKKLPNGNFVPVYIGQADSAKNRFAKHERLGDCLTAGATHLVAHTTPAGERARCDEEADLIQQWQPPLNVQHRNVLG